MNEEQFASEFATRARRFASERGGAGGTARFVFGKADHLETVCGLANAFGLTITVVLMIWGPLTANYPWLLKIFGIGFALYACSAYANVLLWSLLHEYTVKLVADPLLALLKQVEAEPVADLSPLGQEKVDYLRMIERRCKRRRNVWRWYRVAWFLRNVSLGGSLGAFFYALFQMTGQLAYGPP